jgi:hypothetical protein
MQSDTSVLEMETSIEIHWLQVKSIACYDFVRSKSHHRVGQNFTSCTQRAPERGPCLNCMALMDRYLRLCIFPTIFCMPAGVV